MNRRVALLSCLCIAGLAPLRGQALAQPLATGFPNKGVRIIVPFPAGALTDVATRSIAQNLTDKWKQAVTVDNRTGASGVLGADAVSKAPSDGYTLLMGTSTTHGVLPALKPDIPYDNLRDFTPLALVGESPYGLVVHTSVPARTIAELVALLKANPNKYAYGSAGVGSLPHLTGEWFKAETGTQMTHVPYRGLAPVLDAVAGGQVQVAFVNVSDAKRVAAYLRLLGITSATRSVDLPDVPTVSETIPRFVVASWIGLFAPASTPAPVVSKLQRDIRSAIASSDVKRTLDDLGFVRRKTADEDFGGFVRDETERWRRLGKATHIVLE